MPRSGTDRGVALLAALAILAIVSAMALGLALTTSYEPLGAANFEANRSAHAAAEAGVAIAVHELAGLADWNLVLGGLAGSAVLEHGDIEVDLLDGSRAGLGDLTAQGATKLLELEDKDVYILEHILQTSPLPKLDNTYVYSHLNFSRHLPTFFKGVSI